MFNLKLRQQEQGFSLIEVLAAIVIAALFVTIGMQMLAVAALFKARAQEYAEATTWIQADLEKVKYQAANFQFTSLTAEADPPASPATSSTITVASANNFAVNDTLQIGSDTNTYTVSAVSGTQITITPSIQTTQLQGASVIATTSCNAAASNAGFAANLQNFINPTNPSNFSETSSLTQQTFILKRSTTVYNTPPYNVLQITYDVSPTSGGASVASFYTEVIPNAALECPAKQ